MATHWHAQALRERQREAERGRERQREAERERGREGERERGRERERVTELKRPDCPVGFSGPGTA